MFKFGFSCPRCSDGISYPEKFIISVLDQLHIKYIHQLTNRYFKWGCKYIYDFYLIDYNIIIEVNGEQHYKEWKLSKRTLAEEKENDRNKNEFALNHGIPEENYIIINASISEKDFIKKSVLNSKLNKIFNLKNINWDECDVFSQKNLLKEVYHYYFYEMDYEDYEELAAKFRISKATAKKYVRIGKKYNL